jgi:hypothetical protein
MHPFSYSVDMNIKQFKNLLDTSIDEAERQKIQRLLDEEKAKQAIMASESKDK